MVLICINFVGSKSQRILSAPPDPLLAHSALLAEIVQLLSTTAAVERVERVDLPEWILPHQFDDVRCMAEKMSAAKDEPTEKHISDALSFDDKVVYMGILDFLRFDRLLEAMIDSVRRIHFEALPSYLPASFLRIPSCVWSKVFWHPEEKDKATHMMLRLMSRCGEGGADGFKTFMEKTATDFLASETSPYREEAASSALIVILEAVKEEICSLSEAEPAGRVFRAVLESALLRVRSGKEVRDLVIPVLEKIRDMSLEKTETLSALRGLVDGLLVHHERHNQNKRKRKAEDDDDSIRQGFAHVFHQHLKSLIIGDVKIKINCQSGRHDVRVFLTDLAEHSLLLYAVRYDDTDTLDKLLSVPGVRGDKIYNLSHQEEYQTYTYDNHSKFRTIGSYTATPLHVAALDLNKEAVEVLLVRKTTKMLSTKVDCPGTARDMTVFHAACFGAWSVSIPDPDRVSRAIQIVEAMFHAKLTLTDRVDLFAIDSRGFTAIHYACMARAPDLVHTLLALDSGCSQKENTVDRSLLFYVVRVSSKGDVVERILKAVLDSPTGLIQGSALTHPPYKTRLHLQHDVKATVATHSLLCTAAYMGHLDVMHVLLQRLHGISPGSAEALHAIKTPMQDEPNHTCAFHELVGAPYNVREKSKSLARFVEMYTPFLSRNDVLYVVQKLPIQAEALRDGGASVFDPCLRACLAALGVQGANDLPTDVLRLVRT